MSDEHDTMVINFNRAWAQNRQNDSLRYLITEPNRKLTNKIAKKRQLLPAEV